MTMTSVNVYHGAVWWASKRETDRVRVMRKATIDAGSLATGRIGKSSFKMIE
jgi:hypothetical protein